MSTINTTEIIAELAGQYITDNIVNAAKGVTKGATKGAAKGVTKGAKKGAVKDDKTPVLSSFTDEIAACFDFEQFILNASVKIQELINRKIEEAIETNKTDASSNNIVEPVVEVKKKRATKKNEEQNGEVTKRKRATKKNEEPVVVVEEPVVVVEEPVAVIEEPVAVIEEQVVVVEEPVAVIEEQVVVTEEPVVVAVEKPKRKRVTKKPIEPIEEPIEKPLEEPVIKPVEEPVIKPVEEKKTKRGNKDKCIDTDKKNKKCVLKKKEVEVSDSDSVKSEKKDTTLVLNKEQQHELHELYVNNYSAKESEMPKSHELYDEEKSVNTSDFIQPLSCIDELQEEELLSDLSDIEE